MSVGDSYTEGGANHDDTRHENNEKISKAGRHFDIKGPEKNRETMGADKPG